MSNIRRLGTVFAMTALLTVAGAASAWAFTWATSSSPLKVSYDGVIRGGGYGSVSYVSYNHGRLYSYLSDTRVDSMRTFVNVLGTHGANSSIGVQSGRRSDGGISYAKMADKDFYSEYPYGVGQYYYYVKVCMDRSFAFDPCSTTITHSGL